MNKSLTRGLLCSSYITMCYIIKAMTFIWPLLIRALGQLFSFRKKEGRGKNKALTVPRSGTRMSAITDPRPAIKLDH